MAPSSGRIKMNFMIDARVVETLEMTIPTGKRSDFVNEILEAGLLRYRRQKAIEGMDRLAKEVKWKISTKEIIKLKNYGRE